MNEKKLNRAVTCLYATAGLKIVALLYYLATSLSFTHLSNILTDDSFLSSLSLSMVIFTGITVVASLITASALKENKLWAWIGGITICFLSLFSLAFPAALIGLLYLFDKDIRAHYIKELDINI